MQGKTVGMRMVLVFVIGLGFQAHAGKKALDDYTNVVVERFESSVKGAIGLPDAVRGACVQAIKEDVVFSEVVTTEEDKSKNGENAPVKTAVLRLSGHLVDFDPGNAAKRMMVGFGTGRAHASFDFTLRDPATGRVVWQKRVKQTASFWFNGTTSSAAERGELPEGLAKKLVGELKKGRSR
jgi:uncharacterized protein DUF4410